MLILNTSIHKYLLWNLISKSRSLQFTYSSFFIWEVSVLICSWRYCLKSLYFDTRGLIQSVFTFYTIIKFQNKIFSNLELYYNTYYLCCQAFLLFYFIKSILNFGTPNRTRTRNLGFRKTLLFLLSYGCITNLF